MRINRFAAHELPPPRASTLRVELHDPRLHRHPARAGADPTCVPAPPVPAFQSGSDLHAPASGIAPPACLPRSGQLIGVPASAADRETDLRSEALWPMAHGARAARPCHACTTVASPAGTDTKAVVIACHGKDDWEPESSAQGLKSRRSSVACNRLPAVANGGLSETRQNKRHPN
jgi:hypothetical protein